MKFFVGKARFQRSDLMLTIQQCGVQALPSVRRLAGELGVTDPRESVAPPSASRRCSNRRLKDSGYALRYPDYRAGYSAMIASTSMSAPLGNAAT